MSLSITSDAFIWSIRALLLVAVVAIVWGWPRLARRGILPILGRLVALTVVSGLGVINVLAPVNASYGWYLTVADLMPGAEDQRGTAVHQGSASSTAADPPVASAPTNAFLAPTQPAAAPVAMAPAPAPVAMAPVAMAPAPAPVASR